MIRKGDIIKTEMESRGVHITLTGVAHSKEGTAWYTEEGRVLHDERSSAKVTVLQRALPTETGDVLKSAVLKDGTAVGMLVLDSYGLWFDPTEYTWYTPGEITDFEIGEVK